MNKRAARIAGTILLFAIAHFAVAIVVGVLAFGTDFDQLRSRSTISRVAGVLHDVLWFPHDTFLRSVPNAWFVAHARIVTPGAIAGNSILWGIVLSAAWLALRSRQPVTRR